MDDQDTTSFDSIAGTEFDELDPATANTYGDSIFSGADPDSQSTTEELDDES